ncbi:hypothetical protein BRD17_00710 [Halobacteriales archaeon SW_7_68_16]|nr:MAG: hypothetical protein BRD17_00710 [Halobacteriales archaeon SW_7_68_16]
MYERVRGADWLHLGSTEEVIWAGHRTRYTLLPTFLLVGVLAAVGLGLFVERVLPAGFTFLPLALVVIGLAIGGYRYLEWRTTIYVLTNQEIYSKSGIISRDVTHIRYERIQNTSMDQTILGRVLSFGDIIVFTAGTSLQELILDDVPNPSKLGEIVADRLDEAKNEDGMGVDLDGQEEAEA